MVVVAPGPATLDLELLSAYYVKDRLIGNLPVVIFHGPSTTTNSTLNSSRIQAHVFSIAGYASFPRLTISPTSPLYLAVHHLPEEKQGDEICRGLAVGLSKYFAELPEPVKKGLEELVAKSQPDRIAPPIFDEEHAARLAGNMVRVENPEALADHITTGLAEKSLSWVDVDVMLPPNTVTQVYSSDPLLSEEEKNALANEGRPVDYGDLTELVNLFGSPCFLPSSKLRRAPSRPLAASGNRVLAPDAAEKLQREMWELLETEEAYENKLDELVRTVIVMGDGPRHAITKQSEQNLEQLFNGCLGEIARTSTEFLGQLQALIVPEKATATRSPTEMEPRWITDHDPTGAESFAKLLLRFFPRFKDPYQEYIRASAHFPRLLTEVVRESASAFAQALQNVGEQRLRSWLIEPVQRLPRYSLYIDNMVNQLPASHYAMPKLLKAKDIITDICALDSGPTSSHLTIQRLKKLVSMWPAYLAPEGRLITVVDAVEIPPPYRLPSLATEGTQSLLVLFPSCVLVLRKHAGCTLSAKGLFAEIDRPASAPSTVVLPEGASPTKPLGLAYQFGLNETRFMESHSGQMLSLASFHVSSHRKTSVAPSTQYVTTRRSYYLAGSYEGKAARWCEEVAKARIEDRFPEKIRDSEKWALKSINTEPGQLGLVSAIFENDADQSETLSRRLHGRIKVVLDHHGSSKKDSKWEIAEKDVEITAIISILEPGKYQLDFRGLNDFVSTDHAMAPDFMPVFLKRLGNLLRMHHQPWNPMMAQAHTSYMQKIADTLRPRLPVEEGSMRGRFRPPSPVKALTNLLGGSVKENTPSKQHNPFGSVDLVNKPLPPLDHSLQRQESKKALEEDSKASKVTIVQATNNYENGSLDSLETTLNTYIIALHSRAGNIVGRTLRNRKASDELKVNELYNAIVEDPGQHQAAAEVPVDVLFAAFEKFLNRAWKERIGPVLSVAALSKIQDAFSRGTSSEVRTEFKAALGEMAPQNQRAFSAILRLLADLLEAAGNDGDRGALTATFAEALVETDPHGCISLFDHLVDDVEVLFDGTSPIEVAMATPAAGTLDRNGYANAGSVNSVGSSFRKRFGLGVLTRENSRHDGGESRVGQIWRSLSKKASGDSDSQGSLTKSFLSRSKSTDSPRLLTTSRPGSRDRPLSAHSTLDENKSRPGTAASTRSRMQTPPTPGLGEQNANDLNKQRQALRTPSPAKLQKMPPPETPSKVASSRKENVPPKLEHIVPKLTLPLLTDFTTFGSEFPDGKQPVHPNPPIPERKSSSPQKLKVQSPQKVGEMFQSPITTDVTDSTSYVSG